MLKTIALVIRAVDYKENDRILTLLSPRYGRVEAACRGCRKPQSPLLSAAELFSLGEYVLYGRSAHYTVKSFEYQDAFFPVREN